MKRLIVERFVTVAMVMVLILTGTSCNRSKKGENRGAKPEFKIEKVESINPKGITSYDVQLLVKNSTRYGCMLQQATVDVFYSGSKLGSVLSDEEVEVPKRTTASVTLPIVLKIDNPIALYGAYGKIQRGEIDKITLALKATVKVAGVKRTVERNNIPLSEVLSMFGADASDLKNVLKF